MPSKQSCCCCCCCCCCCFCCCCCCCFCCALGLVGVSCRWLFAQHPGNMLSASGRRTKIVCWLVACLTSQRSASVSQGRVCSDKCTCCHTEIEGSDQTCYLTQSQYTDTGTTSPTLDLITSGAWQGSHLSASSEVSGMAPPGTFTGVPVLKSVVWLHPEHSLECQF